MTLFIIGSIVLYVFNFPSIATILAAYNTHIDDSFISRFNICFWISLWIFGMYNTLYNLLIIAIYYGFINDNLFRKYRNHTIIKSHCEVVSEGVKEDMKEAPKMIQANEEEKVKEDIKEDIKEVKVELRKRGRPKKTLSFTSTKS